MELVKAIKAKYQIVKCVVHKSTVGDGRCKKTAGQTEPKTYTNPNIPRLRVRTPKTRTTTRQYYTQATHKWD